MKKHLLTALLGLAVSASAWAAPAGLTAPQSAVNDDGQTAIIPVKPHKSVLRDSMVVTKGDFSYELFTDMTARLTRYNGSETDVVVPASVDTLGMTFKVKEITGGRQMPQGWTDTWTVFNYKVKSITLPEGITTIGIHAFADCSGLKSITLPNTITSIGSGAFSYCSALTSITIPEGVTTIGYDAFYNCTALTSITLPNGITEIEKFGRFGGCTNLSEIKLSEDNPNYATDGKIIFTKDMTTVVGNAPNVDVLTIPATVTNIKSINWDYAGVVDMKGSAPEVVGSHYSSPKLVKVQREYADGYRNSSPWYNFSSVIVADDELLQLNGVNYKLMDGNKAWIMSADTKIQQLDIPSQVSDNGNVYTVTGIADYALANCIGLTSITLPNTITSISNYAFQDCKALTSITIPEGVTTIGNWAFGECSALTSITIPEGVTTIGYSAFSNCSALTSITIPEGVTTIGDNAFSNCSALISIVLPNTLTSIESSTFSSCSGLSSITLPNSLTSIGDWAFSSCSALTSIVLPNSLTSIGDEAFSSCSALTSITLPNSLTSIGNRAFSYCSALTYVKIPASVTSIGREAFDGGSGSKTIVLPSNATSINMAKGALSANNYPQSQIIFPGAMDASNSDSFFDAFLPDPDYYPYETWVNCTIYDPQATWSNQYNKEFYRSYNGSTFKQTIDMTIKPCTALSVSDAGYATYFTNRGAYTMPDGLKGAVITGAADDKLAIDWRYEAGAEVPSATPLLLKGNAGDYYLPTDVQTSKEPDTDNLLKGTETVGFTTADYDALYYKLSYNNEGTQLGFYWGAANGGVFFNPANRCYLALPKAQFAHVKGFSLEGDDTITAITDVTAGNDNAAKAQTIYTLDGRKVNATTTQGLPAGLYIVNGVKTLVK